MIKVCSIGGVGSSALANHVMGSDPEQHKLKHCISPVFLKDRFGDNLKLIFIIGHPIAAVHSVFKRNLQHYHERSMCFGKFWIDNSYQFEYVRTIFENTTIEEYAAELRDAFYMEEHIHNWLRYRDGSTKIRIVKYEHLAEHIDELMDFAECSRKFTVRGRTSNWIDELSEPTKMQLQYIYEGVEEIVSELPSLVRIG